MAVTRHLGVLIWLTLAWVPTIIQAETLLPDLAEVARSEFLRLDESSRDLVGFLDDAALIELAYSGPIPTDAAKTLRIWKAIQKSKPEGIQNPHEFSTAAAVALTYGQKDWPEEKAIHR